MNYSYTQIEAILESMEQYGGSFVSKLPALYRCADPNNRLKILVTWKNYFDEYYVKFVPSHAQKEYPESTSYRCPDCGKAVMLDEWTQTVADHEGESSERTGTSYYCTNKECPNSTEPVDEDYLTIQSTNSSNA